ncbi:MAG: GatB/YqeY domain-containing protein [Verrucomicrobiota bacterium]
MSLSQQIVADIKDAMKAKNQVALTTLRSLKSAIQNATIEKYGADGELDEAEAIALVRKAIKQRQESARSFRDAGRDDLADKEEAEIVILDQYLPKPLSEEETADLVASTLEELGVTSRKGMGAVMKALQEKVAGRVDNKVLSQMVMDRLS